MKNIFIACVHIICFKILLCQELECTTKCPLSVNDLQLRAVTFADHEADPLLNLKRSADVYGVDLEIFIAPPKIFRNNYLDKIPYIRGKIEKYKNCSSVALLVVDAFDVLFNAGEKEILRKFLEFKSNIVYGAELKFLGDADKQEIHEELTKDEGPYKYLNSGTIIGYAPYVYQLFSLNGSGFGDQAVMMNHFLDPKTREELGIELDYTQTLFQTLNAVEIPEDLDIEFSEDDGRVVNVLYKTKPSVLHGNGYYGKKLLRQVSNYVAKSWTPSKGCMMCTEQRIELHKLSKSEYPSVLLGIFVKEETPFLAEMLQKVFDQNYPKKKIFFYLYNNVRCHERVLNDWLLSQGVKYASVEYTSSYSNVSHAQAKQFALKLCSKLLCDVFFNVESEVHLDNPDTLILLISYNRSILAPIMSRENSLYSNFWGDLDGWYYKRSFDYIDIVTGVRRGIWNVPHIFGVYVMWRYLFEDEKRAVSYLLDGEEDVDIAFCVNNRGYFSLNYMYAVNLEEYGHLANMEVENEEKAQIDGEYPPYRDPNRPHTPPDCSHSDLLQGERTPQDWEFRYINPDYQNILKNKTWIKELCSDVFSFPVFSKRFSEDLLKMLWTSGVRRIMDAENEVDGPEHNSSDIINLSEINFEKQWKHIAKKYIEPVVEEIFTGYNQDGNIVSSFVRVSNPMNESALPRLDPSSYAVVTALSDPGIDYMGGEVKFIKLGRKDCAAPSPKSGWVTVYPGKPTHYHQELRVKAGFKYDLVYYVN